MIRIIVVLTLCILPSCQSFVFVNSPWPRIYRTKNVHKKISLKMSDLDALGPEKKKQLIADIVKIATYATSLEASLDAYAVAREKHNTKFKEDTVGKKETSP